MLLPPISGPMDHYAPGSGHGMLAVQAAISNDGFAGLHVVLFRIRSSA